MHLYAGRKSGLSGERFTPLRSESGATIPPPRGRKKLLMQLRICIERERRDAARIGISRIEFTLPSAPQTEGKMKREETACIPRRLSICISSKNHPPLSAHGTTLHAYETRTKTATNETRDQYLAQPTSQPQKKVQEFLLIARSTIFPNYVRPVDTTEYPSVQTAFPSETIEA